MGQTNSKPVMGPVTPNILKDRIHTPVPNVSPSLTAPTPMEDPQINSASQNLSEVEDQVTLFPSPRQRRDSNRAPSSNGYTAVDPDESPSSYRQQQWNRAYPPIHIPTNQRSFFEDEPAKCPCSLINDELAFRKLPGKSSLEIICPKLNESLRNIIDPSTKYQGSGRIPRFIVDEPYKPIFYIRKKFLQGRHGAMDGHSREHIQPLFDFVRRKSRLVWEKLNQIDERICYDIAFKELWLLYPPGETVLNKDDGAWRAYKVDRVEINSDSSSADMTIHCWFLDFDKTGKWLVPHSKVFYVHSYSSERPIGVLDVIPEWYCEELGAKLVERGKKYWEYGRVVSHKRYDGDAWPRTSQEDPVNVIIDYVTSSKHPQETGLHGSQSSGAVCSVCRAKAVQLESYSGDVPHETRPHDDEICGIRQTASSADDSIEKFDTGLLMFCPSQIWAFSLRHKSWKMIQLQELSQIQPQDESFRTLQMDNDKKEDLENVLCGYLKNKHSNIDVIEGKGQGLNVLLHGNPGTGKTLTVESLCEKHVFPLYTLTCGELGNDADAFEDRLQMAFLRAANWRAVLLLEEADIFVRHRDREIQRCAIVSSFLSKLDYSRAVVFMATNRVKHLDSALVSRVPLQLEFPDFDLQAQKEIWKDAINRLQDVKSDDKEALAFWVREELAQSKDRYGHLSMNGRQIRNCISAAAALARGKRNDSSLRVVHIEKILSLGKDFMEFLRQGDNPSVHAIKEEKTRQERLGQQMTP
ncbi:P-loop containing nucleoside triphosphate hydrolase protein [Annulohypoxylon maeteangense]|uniref:P-loop containing nucleoside triphosphate hydrolase protein n=1 Tax=Annulohypoxylon maeteangense TaxID=1927788 RepID=UPI002008ABEC|nr:P-loop containing nucleoside triphosphate hydrolase protein [Annulohypoxylon maeteangense]KAI0887043.1 P-loop containing nucleoside triphosphate hydrolase protein [Annulohypoxylon maeteangense]